MIKNFPVYLMVSSVLVLSVTSGASAQPGTGVDTAQLQQALAERDEIIINLLNRMDAMERRLATLEPQAGVAESVAGLTQAVTDEPTSNNSNDEFAIDELSAERALERGLVQRGVRLLQAGQGQVAPTSSYARLENRLPELVSSAGFAGTQRETEIFDTTLQGRLGLPFDAQLEVSLPYRNIKIARQTINDGVIESVTENSAAAWGNARIGIAGRLLQESSWRPELLGRITWLTGSGKSEDNGISLGGDYAGVGFDFNATWRRDPVVFLLGAGYFRYVDDGLQPGDTFSLSVGTSLALSPESALTLSLDQSFADDFTLDGRPLPGTDQVSSLLNISASTLLGRRTLLQVNAGVGLTPDAPDYVFGVSLPFDAGLLW